MPGTARDRDSLGNMQVFVRVAMAAELSPFVSSHKIGDEVLSASSPIIVDVTIDALNTNAQFRVSVMKPPSDLFGAPARSQVPVHVGPDPSVLQPWASTSITLSLLGLSLSSAGSIGTVNKSLVPFQFS